MRKIGYFLICSLLCTTFLKPAGAQSIDYSEFEEMFGEPVTTSANGSPQRFSEVPLNMEIITAKEIERTGARSIPELLRFIPGLSVRQISFGETEVGIRGYNQASSERILVLLDGRQVYLDAFGQVVWENLPVEIAEIKQIEVVKGPNTALFGFNAVSGVINIITVNPLYDDVKEVKNSVSIGKESMFETSGVFTAKKGNAAVKISAGGFEADDDFKDMGTLKANDTRRKSVSAGTYFKINDNIETQFSASENKYDRNEYIVLRLKGDLDYKSDSVRGKVIADTDYGVIDSDLYFNQLYAEGFSKSFTSNNKILVYKLSDTFEYGKNHIFRLGGEYREGSNIYDYSENADLEYNILTASGLWDWQIDDCLRTSAALRFDHFKLSPEGDNVNASLAGYPVAGLSFTADDYYQTMDEYSVNLGASYKLTDKDILKASYARGVNLPSFTEFGLQMPSSLMPNMAWIGNPYTDTSIVKNYEVAYDHKIEQIDGKFRGALFYQTTDNVIGFGKTIIVDGANQFSLIGNIGDSEMYGFELGFEGKFNEIWDWSLNYTHVSVNDDLANLGILDYQSPNEYEESNAEHTINATLGYTAHKWRADGGIQYTSSYKDLVIDTTALNNYIMRKVDPSVVLNANYSYDMTDSMTWSVSGQNLLGNTSQSVYTDAESLVWLSLKVKF